MSKKTKNFKNKQSINALIILSVIFVICAAMFTVISSGITKLLLNTNILYADSSLRVHFIDVGQGDCIAINLPDKKTMIIDAGKKEKYAAIKDYINTKLLVGYQTKTIDYMILTHSDADHIGSASAILNDYNVKNIYRPKIYCELDSEYLHDSVAKQNTLVYRQTVTAINSEVEEGASLFYNKKGLIISGKNYTIKFLTPEKDYYTTDTNDYSPIIILEAFGTKFMFTGDATNRTENELLANYTAEIDIDILKVSHHGSSNSTSADFINATTPKYAVISVGTNSYGHPSMRVIEDLKSAGVKDENILVTQKLGNIMFALSGSYKFEQMEGNYKIVVYFSDIYILLIFVILAILVAILAIIKYIQSKNKM